MGLYIFAAGVALVSTAAVFSYRKVSGVRAPARAGSRRHGSPAASKHPYYAVAITPCEDACTAVNSLSNSRILAEEAPQVPVPECDRQVCNCTFEHFNDRRQPVAERRRRLERRAEQRRADDRRCGVGRRRSDWRPLAEPALS